VTVRSVLAALLLVAGAPATAQSIAIINGTVATGEGTGPIQGGTVVIRDGKVVAAGPGVAVPADAQVIDASGKWVTPGIVAGFSNLGLAGVSGGAEGANDIRARNGPFSAAIDVVPAINPNYQPIKVNRADGVTRAIVSPATAKSIFAGQGAVIDTGADMYPITKPRVFQFVELGETGAEDAGGSRASAYVLFHNALREASELARYATVRSVRTTGRDAREQPVVQNPNESRVFGPEARRSDDVLLTRFDAAALVPVLQGQQYLVVHAERASDILDVIRLSHEFPSLKIILVGATEGWLVADQIADSGIPVIASPVNDLPASFEQIAATQSNVGRMRDAGVKVSIGMIGDSHMLFNERQYAGNLVALTKIPGATGLSWGEAFAAITSGPAEAIGMGGQIGSLEPGAHGDVVIWSGDPLDPRSAALEVYIDGVRQPLETHQSRLLQRYRNLPRGNLPEAYRH
jgi:imidazolonepropionase-like amidohydrolase